MYTWWESAVPIFISDYINIEVVLDYLYIYYYKILIA